MSSESLFKVLGRLRQWELLTPEVEEAVKVCTYIHVCLHVYVRIPNLCFSVDIHTFLN